METEPPDLSDGPAEGEGAETEHAADDALLQALGRQERAQRAATLDGPLGSPWAELLAGEIDGATARERVPALAPERGARGETPHDTSLDGSAAGVVAETSSTPGTAAFRLLASDENPDARSRDGFHHGLLGEDELERAEAYFRPFDEDEREELVDALLAEVAAPVDNVVPLARPAASAGAPASASTSTLARVLKHDPGSGPWWWIPGGLLIAAAAAIVAWVVWPPSEELLQGSGEDGGGELVAQALPAYVLETEGGLKVVRGDDGTGSDSGGEAGRHRYQRDTRFEWILRPKHEVSGEVGVRGFAFAGETLSAGLPLALGELAQVAPSGSIRVTGQIADLGLEPGRYTIVLVVGRPQDLPQQAEAVGDDQGGAWQVRRIAIVIED